MGSFDKEAIPHGFSWLSPKVRPPLSQRSQRPAINPKGPTLIQKALSKRPEYNHQMAVFSSLAVAGLVIGVFAIVAAFILTAASLLVTTVQLQKSITRSWTHLILLQPSPFQSQTTDQYRSAPEDSPSPTTCQLTLPARREDWQDPLSCCIHWLCKSFNCQRVSSFHQPRKRSRLGRGDHS